MRNIGYFILVILAISILSQSMASKEEQTTRTEEYQKPIPC